MLSVEYVKDLNDRIYEVVHISFDYYFRKFHFLCVDDANKKFKSFSQDEVTFYGTKYKYPVK